MDARLHGRWTMLLAAVGLFAVVTALGFVVGGDTSEGISLLYTLPIALPPCSSDLAQGSPAQVWDWLCSPPGPSPRTPVWAPSVT